MQKISAKNLFRKMLKRIFPPRLTELILDVESILIRFREERRRKLMPVWKGVYSSFSEVPINDTSYYDSNDWTLPKESQIEAILANHSSIGFSIEASRTLIAVVIAMITSRLKNSEQEVTVLDVGGDIGTTFALLQNATSGKFLSKIRYYILEIENCVDVGTTFWKKYPKYSDKLSFVSEFPAEIKPTLIYIGSSIQYFENYLELLRKCLATRPEYLLFFNCHIGDVRTHVTLQINVSNTGIAQWKIDIEEVSSLLAEHGYELIYRGGNAQDYPVSNFPVEYRLNETSNLLFALKHS